MQKTIQNLKQMYSVVTQLTDEVINGNPAKRVLYVWDYRFNEVHGNYTFYYKILYFNEDGVNITTQVAEPKFKWIIDKSMQVYVRDFEQENYPPKEFIKVDEEGNPVLDEEGNPIKEFRKERADIQLRQMATLQPLPTLVEFYAHDLDKDGKFSLL